MKNIKLFQVGVSVVAMLGYQGALSQTAKPKPSANANEIMLGDIVVTANRTESIASKTPVTLTVISGKQLASSGISSTIGLADQVPNLQMNRSNGGLQITIRGVTSNDSTEKGDPSTAFLLDGIYIARPQAQEAGLFDLARVEVLRGPQGTLYGRNTTAGVINVISNKPVNEMQAALNATAGNYSTKQVDAMVNVPLTSALYFRAAAQYDNRDSYLIEKPGAIYNLADYKKDLSLRAQVFGKPTDNFDFLVKFEYADIKGSAFDQLDQSSFYSSTARRTPVYLKPKSKTARLLTNNLSQPDITADKSLALSGEFNLDVGPVTATYLGSYREFKENVKSSRDIASTSRPSDRNTKFEQSSHELRFATNADGPFKAQAGAYYFKEKGALNIAIKNVDASLILPPGSLPPRFVFIDVVTNSNPVKSTSYAFFGQGTYEVIPSLRLTAGARYSNDEKSRDGLLSVGPFPSPPLPFKSLNFTKAAQSASSKVTWRAGLDYDINDTSLLYAVVSTGYKAGGFNDGCEAGRVVNGIGCPIPTPPAELYYKPEELRSYELGLKTGLFDNQVRLNASVFHYDYTNLQLLTKDNSVGGTARFANAPKAKINGVELEAMALFGKHGFDVSATYLDAKYGNYFPVSGVNFKGLALDRSPKFTLVSGYRFTQPVGEGNIVFSMRTRYTSAYYLGDFNNAFQFRQSGFMKNDASLTYNAAEDRFYISAFVRNIEDKVEVTAIEPGPVDVTGILKGSVSGGAPRTFGLRVGIKY
jgi:iron complex outermembrane recepter protein